MFEVKNLGLKLGEREILHDISFELGKNEILLIIGPNGAGKSILLKTLLGFIQKTSGEIYVGRKKIENLRKAEFRIGYVPQRLSVDLDFPITVHELLEHTLQFTKSDQSVEDLLSVVGATHIADKLVGSLSGGQWQRALIARALANDPDLLIMDEPTAGIDYTGESSIFDTIHELHHAREISIILVSHDLPLASSIADKIICLNQSMICYAPPKQALTDENLKTLYGMNLDYTHAEHKEGEHTGNHSKEHRHE